MEEPKLKQRITVLPKHYEAIVQWGKNSSAIIVEPDGKNTLLLTSAFPSEFIRFGMFMQKLRHNGSS